MAKKREDEEKEGIEFDFGVGKISFGGLFKGIGDLFDLASRVSEEGVHKEGEIGGLPKGAKGFYGFSVRTMGNRPVVESFGNIRSTAKGPVVDETREPMVDVFDEDNHILIIAELPGVSKDEIKIEVEGDILKLTAIGRDRKYSKETLLPAKVKAEEMKSAYKNGILEITLPKSNS